MKFRCLLLGRKVMTNLDSILKSKDVILPTKVCLGKAMVFPVVIWIWEVDHKEGLALKNWCFWPVALEKTLESPLDCREIKPVYPKGKESAVVQWCPTLCDPMDCCLPGSSVRGIFQARVLKWVVISFSRGSSQPRNRTWVSHIAGRHFTIWATRKS